MIAVCFIFCINLGILMNIYIKEQRAPLAEQLKDPNVKLQVEAMMASEDAANPLPVVESLFNRCLYAHRTLVQMLHSGFYGPINRGKLPAFEHLIEHNPHLKWRMDQAIEAALDGSNIINGYTDQGLPTDPNGRWPGMHIHGEVFNDWGGGPGGHEGAKEWRVAFMAGAEKSK